MPGVMQMVLWKLELKRFAPQAKEYRVTKLGRNCFGRMTQCHLTLGYPLKKSRLSKMRLERHFPVTLSSR